jgi:DNA-directed RNA polymerase specialized sigma24 family protein
MMPKPFPRQRFGAIVDPMLLDRYPATASPWHEDDAGRRDAARRARRKKVLLAWVRLQMLERLTPRERECMELYYFEGLTLEAAGARTGTNRSSVCRGVQRGLRKLQQAAAEDDSWKKALARLR